MTTQNVLQEAMQLFGASASNNISNKTAGRQDEGFEKIFSQRLEGSGRADAARNAMQKNPGKKDAAQAYSQKTDDRTSISETFGKAETNTVSGTPKDVSDADKALEFGQQEVSAVIPDEVIAAIQSLNVQILETVSEALGISSDELQGMLQDMGIAVQDLMQPEQLRALFMEVKQLDDPMALLTEDGMAEEFAALMENVKQLDSQGTLSREDVQMALKQMTQMPQTSQEEKELDTAAALAEEASSKTENTEEGIPITVIKEDAAKQTGQNAANSGRDTKRGMEGRTEQPADIFVQNLASAAEQNAPLSMDAAVNRIQTMQNIVDQVVEQIKVHINQNSTSMELMLHPESLGKVNLIIESAKDGQLTATFSTQNEMAKVALESQMQTLKENLNQQGMKVNAIEVTVSNFGQEFNQGGNLTGNGNNQQSGQQSRHRAIDLSEFDEGDSTLTDEELLAARVLEQKGGSVEYTI